MPKYTFTVLPAPRFSPVTVTLVPPDSGPRPGVSVRIEGVCEQHKFAEELFHIRMAEQDSARLRSDFCNYIGWMDQHESESESLFLFQDSSMHF